jgi:hypothetical protein
MNLMSKFFGRAMKNIDLSMYKKQLHSISIRKMIILSVVITFVGMAFFTLINIFFGPQVSSTPWWMWLAAVVFMFFFFFVHEILHAFAFIVIGGSRAKDIKFGGNIQQGFLYCTSKRPLSKTAYIATIIFPFIITLALGIALCFIQGHIAWPLAMGVLIGGCAGDLMMAYKISKLPPKSLVMDHPTAPAYYELAHKDALPEGFKEVTEDEEAALAKELDVLRQSNTKSSKVIAYSCMILFIALAVALIIILVTRT